jgi:hypothetical protein
MRAALAPQADQRILHNRAARVSRRQRRIVPRAPDSDNVVFPFERQCVKKWHSDQWIPKPRESAQRFRADKEVFHWVTIRFWPGGRTALSTSFQAEVLADKAVRAPRCGSGLSRRIPLQVSNTVQCFNASTFQRFNVSTFQRFNPSTLQPFNDSTLQRFNASTLQRFNDFNVSTTMLYVFSPVRSISSRLFSLRSWSMVSRVCRAAASRPRTVARAPSTERRTVTFRWSPSVMFR